jgi:hypothetical protein
VLLVGCLAVGACARQAAVGDDVRVEWKVQPNPPVAGAAALGTMTLREGDGRVVRGADVSVIAHMSHPGMTPVLAKVEQRQDGICDVQLQFTMAGDWVIRVTGTLPDGRSLDKWLDVPGVRAAD